MTDNYYGNIGEDGFAKLPDLLKRFLSYTRWETTSDPSSGKAPSTEAQRLFAEHLVDEFMAAGASEAAITPEGIVMAGLPATPGCEAAPAIGFIAHMDTSPEAPGRDVKWQIVHYQGGDIELNREKGIALRLERFPEVAKYAGDDLVVTDGTTLLGADDKAGVAVLVELVRWFSARPDVPHARLCFAVTPDEEIGHGADHFDPEAFGADYAYTIDGGEAGGLDSETFNAAMASVRCRGLNVHPGSAKGKMMNAIRIAEDFLSRFPADETPETTEMYEGFFHPVHIEGGVGGCRIAMLIRDHSRERFEARKAEVRRIAAEVCRDWGEGAVEVEIEDQYRNLIEYLKDAPKVLELAREAIRRCGLTLVELPVRGGTDGCVISSKGLPTANLFTGGLNFHGVYECLPVKSLAASFDVARTLCEMSAAVKSIKD